MPEACKLQSKHLQPDYVSSYDLNLIKIGRKITNVNGVPMTRHRQTKPSRLEQVRDFFDIALMTVLHALTSLPY